MFTGTKKGKKEGKQMFGIFKKKANGIMIGSPVKGKAVELSQVS